MKIYRSSLKSDPQFVLDPFDPNFWSTLTSFLSVVCVGYRWPSLFSFNVIRMELFISSNPILNYFNFWFLFSSLHIQRVYNEKKDQNSFRVRFDFSVSCFLLFGHTQPESSFFEINFFSVSQVFEFLFLFYVSFFKFNWLIVNVRHFEIVRSSRLIYFFSNFPWVAVVRF